MHPARPRFGVARITNAAVPRAQKLSVSKCSSWSATYPSLHVRSVLATPAISLCGRANAVQHRHLHENETEMSCRLTEGADVFRVRLHTRRLIQLCLRDSSRNRRAELRIPRRTVSQPAELCFPAD